LLDPLPRSGLAIELEPEEPSLVMAHAGAPPPRASEVGEARAESARKVEEVATEAETSDTGGLGEILANSSVRVALFAGAEGGEGAGAIAFAAARQAARQKIRCVVVDVGRVASDALGHERPGLADLLAGEASFGEVIQRDDTARVHVIPFGGADREMPMQRMKLVVGALTHTYDKVVVVADKVDDWPDEHVRPDIAAIVCGADTTESLRTELYDFVLARGAHSAVIVRFSDFDLGDPEKSAAA
jgi:Mrp family chromosome partitioning ATPase